MENIGALDAHDTTLQSQGRQKNVGAVVLDDLAHLVKTLEQDRIQLGVRHHHRLHEDFGGHDQVMQALLGTQDGLGALSRDVNQVIRAALGLGRRVAEQAREGRGEVDGRARGRLNQLDILAPSAADERVHGKLQLHRIHVSLEL